MYIKQLTHATGPLWEETVSLYYDIFPKWEREPVANLEKAINIGKSRCMILCKNNKVIGMSLTELYPPLSFAMLGYLFISTENRSQGLGKLLCKELFYFFETSSDFKWLLVEAEAGPEIFYKKLGFNKLFFEYLSPHYNDIKSTEMSLMYYSKTKCCSKHQLCDIVEHIFLQSYYLSPNDPRLDQQRQKILYKEDLCQ